MRKLKLVGAKTYVGPRSKDVLVHKGNILECDDDTADALLKEVVVDLLNNEHPLFIETDGSPKRAPQRVSRQRRAA